MLTLTLLNPSYNPGPTLHSPHQNTSPTPTPTPNQAHMADVGPGGYRMRAVSFAAAALRDGGYSAHVQQELLARG